MDKKALYNLLGKYLNNTCTQEERDLVDHWLDLLQEDKTFAAYTRSDLDAISNRIWQKIQAQTFQNTEIEKPAPRRVIGKTVIRWAVAASIIVILSFAGFQLVNHLSQPNSDLASIIPKTGMLQETNTTGKAIRKVLEDGSVIVLEPNTVLNYPVHFATGKREVYLVGQAYFEIAKNAKRPFFIYHNHLITHVIGTSFTINTRKKKEDAEIIVFTGRVEVSENTELVKAKSQPISGVILTPNQKVVYTQDSRSFTPAIVEEPQPLSGKPAQSLVFDNNEIGQVLNVLSSQYALEIVSENDNINKCTFTGDISKPDLFAKLDIICKAINATYELKETKILIKGPGCE
jgi:transmembrane sensor